MTAGAPQIVAIPDHWLQWWLSNNLTRYSSLWLAMEAALRAWLEFNR